MDTSDENRHCTESERVRGISYTFKFISIRDGESCCSSLPSLSQEWSRSLHISTVLISLILHSILNLCCVTFRIYLQRQRTYLHLNVLNINVIFSLVLSLAKFERTRKMKRGLCSIYSSLNYLLLIWFSSGFILETRYGKSFFYLL